MGILGTLDPLAISKWYSGSIYSLGILTLLLEIMKSSMGYEKLKIETGNFMTDTFLKNQYTITSMILCFQYLNLVFENVILY